MRIILPLAFLCLPACSPVTAQDQTATTPEVSRISEIGQISEVTQIDVVMSDAAKPLVAAARKRLDSIVVYDGRYVALDYPNGDVPATMGVCTDVVIRSLRTAYNVDLQQTVHEDMKTNFSAYPTTWGHTRTDKNIDHRRVPNLEVYFTRAGYALPMTKQAADYRPGDIVSWRLDSNSGDGGLPHIGIVSDRAARSGTPLIIHNIGRGPEESNILFGHRITGHFRITLEIL